MNEENIRNSKIVVTAFELSNPVDMERQIMLNVPFEDKDIKQALSAIGAKEAFTTGITGYIDRASYHIHFQGLEELESFFNACDSVSGKDCMAKTAAILEAEHCDSVEKAIYTLERFREFNFYPDVKDIPALGKMLFTERYGETVAEEARYYIDFETYGMDYTDFHDYGCKLTEHGFIERTEEFCSFESFKEMQQGDEIEL